MPASQQEITTYDADEELEVALNLQEILALDSIHPEVPEVTLMVNGKEITILCDSGACQTACRDSFPGATIHRQRFVRSASGLFTVALETDPVWIRDPQGETCKMSVLLMPQCPINLLGRDGLLMLGLSLVPSPAGNIEIKRRHEIKMANINVIKGRFPVFVYYTLDLPNKLHSQTCDKLLSEGLLHIDTQEEKMECDSLHIVLWRKRTEGHNSEYERALNRFTPAKVTIDYLYFDGIATVAAGVRLSARLQSLYKEWYVPHISLHKTYGVEWSSMGPFVQKGQVMSDWRPDGKGLEYSATAEVYRKPLFWTVQVQEGIHLY
ncbi:uncharacterized protein LOC109522910 [Hippocampus comes]|uniref:uncharacterized protein LOC109522910 n=1 Tax=Hippocampus comes TaxID=109280 RepID=UPI00094E41E3|nr:PREDICTED: uncharacterized protein LOC109522910 [Hippocampus comes]